MNKKIKIGDQEVKVTANAFTPIKYKNTYGEDLLVKLAHISEGSPDIEVVSKLAYIMALQATTSDEEREAEKLGTLEEWLSRFDLMAFYEALPKILEAWGDNAKQSSRPKKAQGK